MIFLKTLYIEIKNILSRFYSDMKCEYLGDSAARVPKEFHSQFVCLGGASEITYQMDAFIPKSAKSILIIGIYGGRDYFYFKEKGKDVYAIDLFLDKRFDTLTICDVQNSLPFQESFFDVVIMAEVIEHLCLDYQALLNIKKVLKDTGLLLLTVPFFHDYQETHVRIHSRVSVTRLLEGAGFKIQNIIERPNLFFSPFFFNTIHHTINAFLFFIRRKTIYSQTLPFFWKLEKKFGEKK